MPEQYGPTFTAGGGVKQLLARHAAYNTRPILLTGGIAYLAGCIVHAASPVGPFIKSVTATMPAATDVVAIVAQDTDLTALGNLPSVGYVAGEFIEGTVFAASGVMDGPSLLLAKEALLLRGMNLVVAAYGDATGSI